MNPIQQLMAQFPFGFVPQQVNGPPPSALPPARVRLALDFLAFLAQKTQERVALNEHQLERLDGQKLTDEESSAQATACNLLSNYFAGKLAPNVWEKGDLSQIAPPHGPGMVMQCFVCAPQPPKPDCPMCKGTGQILVFPTSGE